MIVVKFFSDLRQVCGFLPALRFPPTIKQTAQYNLNIVESGTKHHIPNPVIFKVYENNIMKKYIKENLNKNLKHSCNAWFLSSSLAKGRADRNPWLAKMGSCWVYVLEKQINMWKHMCTLFQTWSCIPHHE